MQNMIIEGNTNTNESEKATPSRSDCIRVVEPVIFAWEGDGIWVLHLNDDNRALWQSFGSTEDYNEHVQWVKACGGV